MNRLDTLRLIEKVKALKSQSRHTTQFLHSVADAIERLSDEQDLIHALGDAMRSAHDIMAGLLADLKQERAANDTLSAANEAQAKQIADLEKELENSQPANTDDLVTATDPVRVEADALLDADQVTAPVAPAQ